MLDNAVFEVHNDKAVITVGDNCMLAYGVIMVCTNKITMGNHVWIGEYTSVRDTTHQFSSAEMIGNDVLPDISEPIVIGSNIWIGLGCLIMSGVVIEDNVIIAANSVVKGFYAKNSMYGGCPAKFIKTIE